MERRQRRLAVRPAGHDRGITAPVARGGYEPGNNAKNYYKVWERYVNPVYPCCYRTMLSYLKTPANELKGLEPTDDKRQLKLF